MISYKSSQNGLKMVKTDRQTNRQTCLLSVGVAQALFRFSTGLSTADTPSKQCFGLFEWIEQLSLVE